MDAYIESTDEGTGNQYWPIVKCVKIFIPNCKVCSTGARLVDLPGVRDSNAARDKVARNVSTQILELGVLSRPLDHVDRYSCIS